jgi:sugar phosphate isomerase/epimerase
VQAFAAGYDVKVCLEMHPGNVVFNPRTLERLATEIGATHVGAEMDPSHLFWQDIGPQHRVRDPHRTALWLRARNVGLASHRRSRRHRRREHRGG